MLLCELGLERNARNGIAAAIRDPDVRSIKGDTHRASSCCKRFHNLPGLSFDERYRTAAVVCYDYVTSQKTHARWTIFNGYLVFHRSISIKASHAFAVEVGDPDVTTSIEGNSCRRSADAKRAEIRTIIDSQFRHIPAVVVEHPNAAAIKRHGHRSLTGNERAVSAIARPEFCDSAVFSIRYPDAGAIKQKRLWISAYLNRVEQRSITRAQFHYIVAESVCHPNVLSVVCERARTASNRECAEISAVRHAKLHHAVCKAIRYPDIRSVEDNRSRTSSYSKVDLLSL